jgi:hypothetical protein
MSTLEPNRDQVEIFVDALLRHRGEEGYLSLRSFLPDNTVFKLRTVKLNGMSYKFLIDAAQDLARLAALRPIQVAH